jgi:hypothetical protein
MSKPFNIARLGTAAALIENGVTASQFETARGLVHGTFADPDLGRQTAKLAADIFEAADLVDDPCFSLYHEMSKSAAWHPIFETYLEPFLEGVKKASEDIASEDRREGWHKLAEAGWFESMVNLIRGGKTISKEVLAGLAGLGVLGGAATGAASWALEKDIDPVATNEPSLAATNEALRRRRDYYRAIAEETKARMERSGNMKVSPTAEVAKASTYV